jgi:hypothetical protein
MRGVEERRRGGAVLTFVCFDLIKLVRSVVSDKKEVKVVICGVLGEESARPGDGSELLQAAGCIALA